jgi:hypothetical protein
MPAFKRIRERLDAVGLDTRYATEQAASAFQAASQ